MDRVNTNNVCTVCVVRTLTVFTVVVLSRYIFMKLKLNKQYDVYNGMMVVHNWLPLVVITALILSKVSLIYRNYLLKLSQVCHFSHYDL